MSPRPLLINPSQATRAPGFPFVELRNVCWCGKRGTMNMEGRVFIYLLVFLN